MRMRTTLGLVAAALALTACGPTGTTGQPVGSGGAVAPTKAEVAEPANSLGGAGEASRKAGTAKFSFTMEADTGTQKLVVGSGTGAIDFANNRYRFSQSTGGEATGGPQGTTNVIVDNGIGYLQTSAGGEVGPWLKMDLTAMLGQSGSADMGGYLELLQGVSESTEVGSDTVRGVATTRYKILIDPNKALEKSPEMRQFLDSLKQLGERFGATGDTELKPMPYDVWLDENGLVQRMQSDTPVTAEDGSQVTARSVVEYYDYGQPVDITPPQVN